jgi:hypothetical protein
MKTTFLKSIFILAIASGLTTGCVNDDDYNTPTLGCVETTLTKTKEVSEIPASTTIEQYTEDEVIEAYVVSSDRQGNFFKSISMQTLDGSKAFSVPVDVESTFATYEPGRKVFIKMKNLYTDISNGGMRIGGIFVSTSGTPGVGRLTRTQVQASVFRSCTVVNEEDLVQNLTILDLLNDNNINKLIELDNVQFEAAALGKTYYVEGASNTVGGATNHLLVDRLGNSVVFRTSSFASFASKAVQTGSGKVRGVLTKFGDTYQFVARFESDINLTQSRLTPFTPFLSENFESLPSTGNNVFVNLPNWSNVSLNGTERWEARSFNNNKYAQMSAFGTGESNVDSRLITAPVDLSTMSEKYLRFGMKVGFYNGVALSVWYSTDYSGAGTAAAINAATWTELPTNIASITDSSYATNFYTMVTNLSSINSNNVYIAFRYQGSAVNPPVVTTTYQIDNVEFLGQ